MMEGHGHGVVWLELAGSERAAAEGRESGRWFWSYSWGGLVFISGYR